MPSKVPAKRPDRIGDGHRGSTVRLHPRGRQGLPWVGRGPANDITVASSAESTPDADVTIILAAVERGSGLLRTTTNRGCLTRSPLQHLWPLLPIPSECAVRPTLTGLATIAGATTVWG